MRALVLVDIQNDFLPGGALAVPDGNAVIPVANALQAAFPLVVCTQDWHPTGHKSFASQHPGKQPGDQIQLEGLAQTLWPDHCVQGTRGAELAADLDMQRVDTVFHKGTDRNIDSYSTFFDNEHRKNTGLRDYLEKRGVDEVWVAGLATDYCVLFSTLDARQLGFRTFVVEDGCRAVDLAEGDGERAFAEMARAGVRITRSDQA